MDKLTTYLNGFTAKMPNKRIHVAEQSEGVFEIVFVRLMDKGEPPVNESDLQVQNGRVLQTRIKLSLEGAMALVHGFLKYYETK